MSVLIDTNILLRFFLEADSDHGKKAISLVEEIRQGKVKGMVTLLVINEYVWVIQKFYKMKKNDFVPLFINFLNIPGISVLEYSDKFVKKVLSFYQGHNLDLIDCYLHHISELKQLSVASFDRDFEKLGTDLYNWE